MRRARRTWFLAVLGVGVPALIEPAVAAENPRCGSTLTHSVKLTANMICRVSDGLDIGRSGITINLNGHTIKGRSGSSSYYGIHNVGYRDVTIENGIVRNFEDGIHEEHSNGSRIVRVTVPGAYEAGILYELSKHSVIDYVGVFGTRQGIYLYENRLVNVTDSTSNHNLYYGLYDYGSASKVDHVKGQAKPCLGQQREQLLPRARVPVRPRLRVQRAHLGPDPLGHSQPGTRPPRSQPTWVRGGRKRLWRTRPRSGA